MEITLWGVRAQTPTPGKRFVKYGGNTPCIEIRNKENQLIILEAGTGIRQLGNIVMANDLKQGPLNITLLISDVRWDHTQGYPFFIPSFIPTTTINWYGPGEDDGQLETFMLGQMNYSVFPIRLSEQKSTRNFHDLEESEISIHDITIRAIDMQNQHYSLGFSFQEGDKKLVYLPGYELPEIKSDESLQEKFIQFSKDAHILIHDSFYASNQAYSEGWAHSSFEHAIEFASLTNPETLVFFGFHPDATDSKLDKLSHQMKQRAEKENFPFQVITAYEGLKFEL